jgi:hypothetical protein
MNKFSRRGVATAVAVLAAAAGSLTWAATAASAATAAHQYPDHSVCEAHELAVWVNADSANPGAGNTYYNLDYTNIGDHACWLAGYPDVIAADFDGMPIGAPAEQLGYGPNLPVELAPGESAHSVLDYIQGSLTTPGCMPERSSSLDVKAPSSHGWRSAFFVQDVCSHRSVISLKVGAVERGAA